MKLSCGWTSLQSSTETIPLQASKTLQGILFSPKRVLPDFVARWRIVECNVNNVQRIESDNLDRPNSGSRVFAQLQESYGIGGPVGAIPGYLACHGMSFRDRNAKTVTTETGT